MEVWPACGCARGANLAVAEAAHAPGLAYCFVRLSFFDVLTPSPSASGAEKPHPIADGAASQCQLQASCWRLRGEWGASSCGHTGLTARVCTKCLRCTRACVLMLCRAPMPCPRNKQAPRQAERPQRNTPGFQGVMSGKSCSPYHALPRLALLRAPVPARDVQLCRTYSERQLISR